VISGAFNNKSVHFVGVIIGVGCYFMCILSLPGRVFWLLFIFIYLGVKIGVFVTYVYVQFGDKFLMFCWRDKFFNVLLLCVFVYICLY
jgi:hypothetical protein